MNSRPSFFIRPVEGFLISLLVACFLNFIPEAQAQSFEFDRSFGSVGTAPGQFQEPAGLAVDSQSQIIVADKGNQRIQICDDQGSCTAFGSGGTSPGQFNGPTGVAVDSLDRIIVTDTFNHRIQVCDHEGNCSVFGSFGTAAGQFNNPFGVAVDSQDQIIVADGNNLRIQICDDQGSCTAFGSGGTGPGQFEEATGVAVDSQNRIIVTDTLSHRVQVCDHQGSCTVFGGFGTAPGQFNGPTAVAVDSLDRIVVGDLFNSRFQVCSDQGICTAFAGEPGMGDEPAQFQEISGIAIDSQDRIFIADAADSLIQIWRDTAAPVFTINAGLNDAWFNPDTAGQGFFIIVWEDSKLVFLAWFTYDTERPPEDVSAILGEPGHRWVTGLGPYEGDTALLDVFSSSGMIFDSAEPPVTTEQLEGATIEIVWSSCTEGILKYDIPSLELSGEIPIQRIVDDNVAACEAAQTQ